MTLLEKCGPVEESVSPRRWALWSYMPSKTFHFLWPSDQEVTVTACTPLCPAMMIGTKPLKCKPPQLKDFPL